MKIAIDSKLSKEVREVFQYAISTLSEVIPCDGASIMLKEGDNIVMRLYALRDPSEDVEGKLGISVKIGERIAGKAVEERKTMVVIGDAGKDKRFTGVKKYQEILWGMATPIIKGESCVGVLNLKRTKIKEVLSDAQVRTIEKFAKNLGEVL